MNTTKVRTYLIGNFFATVLVLIINYLAISLPLNNRTTDEISDMYPNYFVPAGFTFSIWGIIYMFMIFFIVYTLIKYKTKDSHVNQKVIAIGPMYFFSGLANVSWIVCWHYQFVLSSICVMVLLLFFLTYIYKLFSKLDNVTTRDRFFMQTFFSIYLGWISVATISNITAGLVFLDWNRFGLTEPTWAILMICLSTILGLVIVNSKKDVAFGLVIVWAIFGIYSKQSSGVDFTSENVAFVSKICGTLLSMYILLMIIGKKTYFHSSQIDQNAT